MAYPIGFSPAGATDAPRPCLVEVAFSNGNRHLTYYNDRFDLRVGDLVYVSGKLAGQRGRVTQISYNFKIRRAAYQRVLAVVNTRVSGRFHPAGRCLITFDRGALPGEQVLSWFQAPPDEQDEILCGYDETTLPLDDLSRIPDLVMTRGTACYQQDAVQYLSLDGTEGYAIVEGNEWYEVAFRYESGAISRLTCSCYNIGPCKHTVAALLQLRDTLRLIARQYATDYHWGDAFALIDRDTLLSVTLEDNETTGFTL